MCPHAHEDHVNWYGEADTHRLVKRFAKWSSSAQAGTSSQNGSQDAEPLDKDTAKPLGGSKVSSHTSSFQHVKIVRQSHSSGAPRNDDRIQDQNTAHRSLRSDLEKLKAQNWAATRPDANTGTPKMQQSARPLARIHRNGRR